jgi:hypothetical protein
VPRDFRHVQRAAGREGQRLRVRGNRENAQQHQRRADDGVNQVLNACRDRFLAAGVHHQRHGQQRHGFVEHVEGDQTPGHAQPHQHAQRQQIQAVETLFMPLVRHVVKRVEPRRRPDERHQHTGAHADAVHMQRNFHVVRQREERQVAPGRQKRRKQRHERQNQPDLHRQAAFPLRERLCQQKQPRQHGQQQRKKQP